MIAEREDHFTEEELRENNDYFPKFLILRRPASAGASDAAEWQGFVKDLKNAIKGTAQKTKLDISQILRKQEKVNSERF